MGKSFRSIGITQAKVISRHWMVETASSEAHFLSKEWLSKIESAEIDDDNNEIIFRLKNEGFVCLERPFTSRDK